MLLSPFHNWLAVCGAEKCQSLNFSSKWNILVLLNWERPKISKQSLFFFVSLVLCFSRSNIPIFVEASCWTKVHKGSYNRNNTVFNEWMGAADTEALGCLILSWSSCLTWALETTPARSCDDTDKTKNVAEWNPEAQARGHIVDVRLMFVLKSSLRPNASQSQLRFTGSIDTHMLDDQLFERCCCLQEIVNIELIVSVNIKVSPVTIWWSVCSTSRVEEGVELVGLLYLDRGKCHWARRSIRDDFSLAEAFVVVLSSVFIILDPLQRFFFSWRWERRFDWMS